MKLRVPTTASRSWLTPYEIIKGYAPSISHCVPFFTGAFATVLKDKRAKLKKKGQGHLRAEEGRLVGYRDLWTDTPKILLSENRMIHSCSVTYDLSDYQVESSTTQAPSKDSSIIEKLLVDLAGEGIDIVNPSPNGYEANPTAHPNPLFSRGRLCA